MSQQSTDRAISSYPDLIAYFSQLDSGALKPISHPDKSVNQIVDGQEDSLRRAAVLIPVTRPVPGQEHKSKVVLTVRSENLRSHAGQISLPGGTRDEQDADEVATALRESEEEIGLSPQQVDVLGRLGDMALPSGFRVTPIVATIDADSRFTASPDEVADIFLVPLELILNVEAYSSSTMIFKEKPRQVLELYYEDYRIWGATAAILYHLAEEVANCRLKRC